MIAPGTEEVIVDPETGRPIADPVNIERAAEEIRARLAPRPKAGQVRTPDSIVDDLEWAKFGAGQAPAILRDADRARRVTKNRLDRARAAARLAATGKSADQREAEVVEATQGEQDQYDAAEVAYDFAKAVARSVEASQSAVQTQAAMVRVTYGLAGTGRGHE